MHVLAGLDRLTSGATYINNIRLDGLADNELTELRRERVGLIFQAFNLVQSLSVDENIRFPLLLGGLAGDERWIQSVIDVVGLRTRLHHRPSELSGGQQQRVAVARALASKPAIIFADEPTGNVDSRTGAEILGFMRRSVDEFGQTIVMVTHDPVAAGYADQVVFLSDGKVVYHMFDPTSQSVFERMKGLASLVAAV
jgi:putative ABC transport system ATP-binding protein